MEKREAILKCLEKVSGISGEELEEAEELNLVEEGILDSLAVTSLLSLLEKELDCTLDTGDFSLDDFVSADTIEAALERTLNK